MPKAPTAFEAIDQCLRTRRQALGWRVQHVIDDNQQTVRREMAPSRAQKC